MRAASVTKGSTAIRDPRGEVPAGVNQPEALARQAVTEVVQAGAAWGEHLGGFYDVAGVRALLAREGRPVSKQAGLGLDSESTASYGGRESRLYAASTRIY